MLWQSLRALCLAPGGPGSIWNQFGAPVRSTGVSRWFACGFRTDLHYADATGAVVHLSRSGGQPSAHIWGKCLTNPTTKRTIRGRTTPVASGIKSIAAIHRQQDRGRLKAPASVSLRMVAMISGQRLGPQAASSTSQATSWP